MMYEPNMTHSERAARRRRIAEAVRRGLHPAYIAGAYGVSIPRVYVAMREHGVNPQTRCGRPRARREVAA